MEITTGVETTVGMLEMEVRMGVGMRMGVEVGMVAEGDVNDAGVDGMG